jgi:hypothetical protein
MARLAGWTMGLALVGMLLGGEPSVAASRFDGNWSVLIQTLHGGCDPGYLYVLRIVNGVVQYDGSVSLSGRVSPNGSVRVALSAGGSRASGVGRLGARVGSGTWNGSNGSSACSGRWTAQRR